MAQRGPVATTVVVLGGLVGLLTANSANDFVVAGTPRAIVAPPAATKPTVPSVVPKKPAPPRFPAQVVYAGKAKNSRIAIAVAVKGDQAAAYLCDGRAVEAWLRGRANDGTVELTSKSGRSHLVARLDGKRLTGSVRLSTKDYTFGIAVAPPPARLYRARSGGTTIGWIVLPDGSQVGVETTAAAGETAPALDPARGSVTVGGRQVAVAPVAGDSTFE